MIGPNVDLVRLPATMVLRNVGSATAVLAGCFSAELLACIRLPSAVQIPEPYEGCVIESRIGRE